MPSKYFPISGEARPTTVRVDPARPSQLLREWLGERELAIGTVGHMEEAVPSRRLFAFELGFDDGANDI
jgi:hypothetical protein